MCIGRVPLTGPGRELGAFRIGEDLQRGANIEHPRQEKDGLPFLHIVEDPTTERGHTFTGLLYRGSLANMRRAFTTARSHSS